MPETDLWPTMAKSKIINISDHRAKKKRVSLRDSWLDGHTSRLDEYAVFAARRILEGRSEEEVRFLAETGVLFVDRVRELCGPAPPRDKIDPTAPLQVIAALFKYRAGDSFESFQCAILGGLGLLRRLEKGVDAPLEQIAAALALQEAAAGRPILAYKFALLATDCQWKLVEAHQRKNAPDILMGKSILRSLKHGREMSARLRHQTKLDNQKAWRELAIEAWTANPGWTLTDMAKWIKKKKEAQASVGTIKNSIKGIKTVVLKPRSK